MSENCTRDMFGNVTCDELARWIEVNSYGERLDDRLIIAYCDRIRPYPGLINIYQRKCVAVPPPQKTLAECRLLLPNQRHAYPECNDLLQLTQLISLQEEGARELTTDQILGEAYAGTPVTQEIVTAIIEQSNELLGGRATTVEDLLRVVQTPEVQQVLRNEAVPIIPPPVVDMFEPILNEPPISVTDTFRDETLTSEPNDDLLAPDVQEPVSTAGLPWPAIIGIGLLFL